MYIDKCICLGGAFNFMCATFGTRDMRICFERQ